MPVLRWVITGDGFLSRSVNEWSERRRSGSNWWRSRHVEHEPQEIVIPDDGDHVYRALFAEARDRAGVGSIADALVVKQLGAEVVDEVLIGRHAGWPPSFSYRFHDCRVHSRLQRDRLVHRPLVTLRQVPGRDQNH